MEAFHDSDKLQFIKEITFNADGIQKSVLEEILSRNAEVEYLTLHGLDGRTYRQSFKEVIPIVDYRDFKPIMTNGNEYKVL